MKTIAIAAYSGPPSEQHASTARIIIGELSRCCLDDVVIAVGGYWGLMKTIVDEALSHGFRVVIYPYAGREDLDYPGEAIVVKTGLTPEARSILLVRSGDILIALGGGVGTMIEVLLAYSMGKPVYLLKSKLPSDKLEVFAPYIDERKLAELKVYGDPIELARDACLFLISQRTPSLKRTHG